MTISTGDKIPSVTLKTMVDGAPADITTDEIFGGKKVVMFNVPGAFTPGCSLTHLPGFVVNADNIKAAGVDTIVCVSVNDAFVMDAWGKDQNAEAILMLADGNAELAEAMGVTFDGSGYGMGTRALRYALIANDGVIEYFEIDQKGIEKSSAETVLDNL